MNRANKLEAYLDAATFQVCYITDIEEISCGGGGTRGGGSGHYYIYYATAEKCGNQMLEGDLDFMKDCGRGDSHREDEGQHFCYVADCDEKSFVLHSTTEKLEKWESAGIALIVLGSLCFLGPVCLICIMGCFS